MLWMIQRPLLNLKSMIPLLCAVIILTFPATSHPGVGPVISKVMSTATFSWEIPQESSIPGASFYTINPSGRVVFILISSGTFIVTDPYAERVVFYGSYSSRNITFTMASIQASDNGTYTCGIGGVTPVIANCGQKLIILGNPTTPSRPMTNKTPVYNQPVTLTCSSSSTTVPADHGLTLTYNWQRDGHNVTSSSGSAYTFTVNTRNTQNYRCMARESQGLESEYSPVYNMKPLFSPIVDMSFDSQLQYASSLGDNVTVSVLVLSTPFPTFTWSKTGLTSQNLTGSLIPASETSAYIYLHLTQLQPQDFANYTLHAGNGVGTPLVFTASIVPAGPPDTPSNLTVTVEGPNSLSVSWKQEDNGGSSQRFIIEYSVDKLTWNTAGIYNESIRQVYMQQIISSLQSGTTYYIRVAAKNKFGESSYTTAATAATEPAIQANFSHQPNIGIITGAVVGSLTGVLIITSIVIILVRKGVRCVILKPGTETTHKRSTLEEQRDCQNTTFSMTDSAHQYDELHTGDNKQAYAELQTYMNVEAKQDQDNNVQKTSVYEKLQDSQPVPYDSLHVHTYQNAQGQSTGSPNEAADVEKQDNTYNY